jgi:hypothetical protein
MNTADRAGVRRVIYLTGRAGDPNLPCDGCNAVPSPYAVFCGTQLVSRFCAKCFWDVDAEHAAGKS